MQSTASKQIKYLIRDGKEQHEVNPLLVKVSRKSKTKELIETALSILTDKGQVIILGCEESITKAITVAEIIKRLQPLL